MYSRPSNNSRNIAGKFRRAVFSDLIVHGWLQIKLSNKLLD
jgi:hypothetical protein